MTQGVRLVLLDFDGTLADSRAGMLAAVNGAAVRFGFRVIDAGEAEGLRGLDAREVMRVLGVPRWKLPLIARHLRHALAEGPPPPLFPGVVAMLERLASGGIALALVSSNSEANARRALGPASALVTHWACQASLFGKAALFRRVLRRAGVPAAEAVAIGDELRDIAAARAAGLRAAAVTWGFATPEALSAARPDALLERIEDIPRWLGLRR